MEMEIDEPESATDRFSRVYRKCMEEREKWEREGGPLGKSEMRLLGTINTTIECGGSGAYEQLLTQGQNMDLIRDYSDLHAIRATNSLGGHHVGYIHRSVARVLAPLLDSRTINVRCVVAVTTKNCGELSVIPCQLHVSTEPGNSASVESSILDARLDFVRLDDAIIFGSSSPHDDAVDPPKAFITTDLLLHQKQGLAWLLRREGSRDLPPFWKLRNGRYFCVMTKTKLDERPEPVRGGILADDMGLGKTLTFLSLIACDKCGSSLDQQTEGAEITIDASAEGESARVPGPKPTLVVCPSSRLPNWASQIAKHTSNLKACVLNEGSTLSACDLLQHDIILTTYDTLFPEFIYASDRSPAFTVEWHRVILDKPHKNKNLDSREINAFSALKSQRRWASTGISLRDGCLDLFPLVAFLNIRPLSVKSCWENFVQRPFGNGSERELLRMSRLQEIMKPISLMRTKDMNLVGLPSKSVETCFVVLSAKERSLYDQIESNARGFDWNYICSDKASPSYGSVLGVLLQLCQVYTSVALCHSDPGLPILPTNNEDDCKDPELLEDLISVLQDGEDVEYSLGITPQANIGMTKCAQSFNQSSSQLTRCSLSNSDLSSPSESGRSVFVGGGTSKDPVLLEDLISVLQDGEDIKYALGMAPQANIGMTKCAQSFNQSSWQLSRCSLSNSDLSSPSESGRSVFVGGGTSSKVKSSWQLSHSSLSNSDLSSPSKPGRSVSVGGGTSSKVNALLNLLSSRDGNPTIKPVILSHFRKMLIVLQKRLDAAGYKTFCLDGVMSTEKRDQVIEEFTVMGANVPAVLLASFKALGTSINLTSASRVYLMEPWLNLASEKQAMDSVYQIGQTQDVKVVRLIAKNTIEEKIMEQLEKKRELARGVFLQGWTLGTRGNRVINV